MPRILFFEDHPTASLNRLFRLLLRHELRDMDVQLAEAWAVTKFEQYVREEDFAVVILDIMARTPEPLITDTGKQVPYDFTGIELLRRLRAGYYRPYYRTSTIFIRSARYDSQVVFLADKAGHNGYFQSGGDDLELIAETRARLSEMQNPAPASTAVQPALGPV